MPSQAWCISAHEGTSCVAGPYLALSEHHDDKHPLTRQGHVCLALPAMLAQLRCALPIPNAKQSQRELGGLLQGVVVFFPSFSYADEVYEHWQASGALRRLSNRKHVFREPRSAVEVEAVLRQVTRSKPHREALLQHILRRMPLCWGRLDVVPLCCGSPCSNVLCEGSTPG